MVEVDVMKSGNFKEIDDLYENNKAIIDKLMNEKKLLENVFLDNRLQERFKKDLFQTYRAIDEIIEKRSELDAMLRKTKEIPGAVGVIYNKIQQRYISYIIQALKKASISKQIDIICFTIDKVDIQSGLVNGIVISGDICEHRCTAIPSAICNIGCHSGVESKSKIKQLSSVHNAVVVNPVNIFNQAIMFDIVSSLPNSKVFLLPFAKLTPSIINEYFKDTEYVFLIPERGIYDNKSIKIKKRSETEDGGYSIEAEGTLRFCSKDELFRKINGILGNKKYMVMKGSKVLNWNGSPLEARIYVQKGITGKWNITEMIAKNEIFSNASKYKDIIDNLNTVLLYTAPEKIKAIESLLASYSMNICVYLEHHIPGIANCTIDFIIDENGMPFFTHFGGWEQKDFLYKLNGENIWDKYMNCSIDYLIYLKMKKEKGGGIHDLDQTREG
jgi:hypothetical protein